MAQSYAVFDCDWLSACSFHGHLVEVMEHQLKAHGLVKPLCGGRGFSDVEELIKRHMPCTSCAQVFNSKTGKNLTAKKGSDGRWVFNVV